MFIKRIRNPKHTEDAPPSLLGLAMVMLCHEGNQEGIETSGRSGSWLEAQKGQKVNNYMTQDTFRFTKQNFTPA